MRIDANEFTQYRTEHGGHCSSCNAAIINGHYCHEHGCPQSWRDERRECDWCGTVFTPDDAQPALLFRIVFSGVSWFSDIDDDTYDGDF